MHRGVHPICLLAMVIASVAIPLSVSAEDELEDEFALLEDEIVYAPARHQQDINESPAAVSVITREQIANTHCMDIACLLRQVPELDVLRIRPMYHAVGARAMNDGLADKALVLLDGRELLIEALGLTIWQCLPIHIEDIERIEIIRGPGSALYGANAHSLVVSISTRRPGVNYAEAFAAGGELDRLAFNVRLGQSMGPWAFQFNGGRETAGNLDEPAAELEMDLYRARLRIDRDWDAWGDSLLSLGVVRSEGWIYTRLAPAAVSGLHSHAQIEHRTDLVQGRIWFNFFDTDFSFDLPLTYMGFQVGKIPEVISLTNATLDADVQAHWSPFEGNLLTGGANYRWLAMYASQNEPDEIHQHRVGLFIQDEQRLFDQLILNGGVRLDYNSITPFTVSPRLAMVWRFTRNQLLRLSGGQAYRKPSFFNTSVHVTGTEASIFLPELPDFIQRSIGNESLENESLTAFEIGYRGRLLEGALTVESDVFFNLYRNGIRFQSHLEYFESGFPDLANSIMRFENTGGDVNCLGGSLSLIWRPIAALRLSANYTYRHSWFATEPAEGEADPSVGKGDRVPWEPAHLANLAVHGTLDFGLRAGAAFHFHSGTQLQQSKTGELLSGYETVENPAAFFTSLYASWRFQPQESPRWLEIGVRAYNVFNEGYWDRLATWRLDGVNIGGQALGRLVSLFIRGGL
ncbi:MAG: TonB-dependent receptor [Deltaproteobacteria bacterium]|nr:TonB-dependent receptor [Deltaproteobacteria bacterium]